MRQRPRNRHWATVVLLLLWLATACQDSGPATNQPPVAAFSATPTSGTAPLAVTFDATASFDPDGTITAYQWDFGDGDLATGATTVHVYTAAGTFSARLTVTDNRGAASSTNTTITVTEPATTGTISGQLTVGSGPAAADKAIPPSPAAASALEPAADVVAGEVIVRFADALAPLTLAPLTVAGVHFDAVRPLAVAGAQLYRSPGLDRAATLVLAHRLQARPDVLYAHPNYVLHAAAVPNDPFYSFQWHYPRINLEAAWDITTGSSDIVVAVGDTGILHAGDGHPASHPDLVGRVLPGYDFISDPRIAGDGDGRDDDPFDVGDNPGGQSTYHGSHVAGTIGAATDNDAGVAGVDWAARIVPVRMLGIGGGTLVDIVEGTLWAAGFSVAGVPSNPHPAHVINLSLGGEYSCTPFEQEAFDRIASASPRNAVVVVAAGNASQNAAGFSPASCRNVITVGATEFRDHRSPYSNYGSRIDVMAPGGDLTVDRNADGFPDGVLSLSRDDGSGSLNYVFQQGTSMAAPHVAGVVSLMKSLAPDLTAAQSLTLLRATARPLSDAACGRPSSEDCGAGLIDAAAVLAALQAGEVPTPGDGSLAFDPNPLDFGGDQDTRTLALTNAGAAAAAWSIVSFTPAADNPGDMPAGTVLASATSGAVPAGATVSVEIGIDRSWLSFTGAYQFTLDFDVDGSAQPLTVRFRFDDPGAYTPQGATIVAAFLDTAAGFVLSGFQEDDGFFDAYELTVEAGEHLVIAWVDENGNLEVDEGDYLGVYPASVLVAAGGARTGVDVVIERVLSTGAVPPSAPQHAPGVSARAARLAWLVANR